MVITNSEKIIWIDYGMAISEIFMQDMDDIRNEIEDLGELLSSENIGWEHSHSLLLKLYDVNTIIESNNIIISELIDTLGELKNSIQEYDDVNLLNIGRMESVSQESVFQINAINSVSTETTSNSGILSRTEKYRESLASAIEVMDGYKGFTIESARVLGKVFLKEVANETYDSQYTSFYPKIENFLKNNEFGKKVSSGIYNITLKQVDLPEILESKFFEQETKKYKLPERVNLFSLTTEVVETFVATLGGEYSKLLIFVAKRIIVPEQIRKEYNAVINKLTKNDFKSKYKGRAKGSILQLAESISEKIGMSNSNDQLRLINRLSGKSRSEVISEVEHILREYGYGVEE